MKKPAKPPIDRPGNLEQRFTSLLTRLLRVSKQEIQGRREGPPKPPANSEKSTLKD